MPEKPVVCDVKLLEPYAPEYTEARPSGVIRPMSSWARWMIPSLADVFFVVIVYVLAFSPISAGLLSDADIGWHIRNGEHILKTLSAPRADHFSYTMAGRNWFAWEWLYDLAIAGIHSVTMLNGVVLVSAFVIAATYAVLYRLILLRTGRSVISVLAVLLGLLSSQVHILARPHILTWLLTVVWLWILFAHQDGRRRLLFVLPVLMILWVNVHGGFLVGLVLMGMFGLGEFWTYLTSSTVGNDKRRAGKSAIELLIATTATLLATFLTPYGYKLHVHVAQYLSNRYLMDHINEFLSPNFHWTSVKWFESLLVVTMLAAMVNRKKPPVLDILLVLFAVHTALYAARNIPISAILLSVVGARWLATAHDDYLRDEDERSPTFTRRILLSVKNFSDRIEQLEQQLRGHLPATVVVFAAIAIAVHGGRVGKHMVFSAHFSETKFPTKAAEFLNAQGIRDHMFNTDDWSGYLIYRLPENKVFFDDRHDFYGEAFIKEFMTVRDLEQGWRDVLNKYDVRWILLPANQAATNALKETSDWKPIYDDGQAVVFSRAQGGRRVAKAAGQ